MDCDIDVENLIDQSWQHNTATGEGAADISQTNNLNGIEAEGIPSINQVVVADNRL